MDTSAVGPGFYPHDFSDFVIFVVLGFSTFLDLSLSQPQSCLVI